MTGASGDGSASWNRIDCHRTHLHDEPSARAPRLTIAPSPDRQQRTTTHISTMRHGSPAPVAGESCSWPALRVSARMWCLEDGRQRLGHPAGLSKASTIGTTEHQRTECGRPDLPGSQSSCSRLPRAHAALRATRVARAAGRSCRWVEGSRRESGGRVDVCHAHSEQSRDPSMRRATDLTGGVMTNEPFDQKSWERRWAASPARDPGA